MRRFWLECGETTIALHPRAVLIGRSRECDLVVNDAAVSRRHARLEVDGTHVTIEDLGSANGVLVNGNRIPGGSAPLTDGDQIQIGPAELVLKSEAFQVPCAGSLTPQTMPGFCALPHLPARVSATAVGELSGSAGAVVGGAVVSGSAASETGTAVAGGENESTEQRHAIDSLGAVADKLLALGRVEDAERMLTNMLHDIIGKARGKRASALPAYVYPKAAEYAVLLADATGRGKWVDYAIELFHALNRPLPAAVVDQLYETVRKVSGVDLAAFRAYVESLRQLRQVTAAERFVIQRLQGLTSLLVANARS